VIERVASWVGKMLRMFGLGEGGAASSENVLGWGDEHAIGTVNRDEILMPYLRALSTFRDGVRRVAIKGGDGALKEVLALCDQLRDVDLVELGVALDDQEGGTALVKLADPAQLKKARDEKRAIAEVKAAKKAAAAETERQKYLARIEKGRVPPGLMFKPPNVPEGTYGSYDETGVPLTDSEGKPLSKSAVKRIQKDMSTQSKLHQDFLEWQKSQAG